MRSIIQLLILTLFSFIQGCSSLTNSLDSASIINQLVIAEPVAVSYKSEVAILRLSEIIQRAEITDEQRAQMLYARGIRYDGVGLRSLARLDFNHALKLKPSLADAHNFIGIQYTQIQEFNLAYEAFDSTLELKPEHEYALLNRGIALYYGGRPSLALDDFQMYHQNELNDPYRLIWIYLAENKLDPTQARLNLEKSAEQVSDNIWAKSIIHLYLGRLSQQEFIGILTNNVTTNKELGERLCEAYFYLGKYNQLFNKNHSAANFFKLALSTNVFEFVEHRYAKLELDLMRKNTLVNKPE